MKRYVFEVGEVSMDRRQDDVSVCVEVPGDSEEQAAKTLQQHLWHRAGGDDPDMTPFVVDEDGIQFRFYVNRNPSDIEIENICDMIEED